MDKPAPAPGFWLQEGGTGDTQGPHSPPLPIKQSGSPRLRRLSHNRDTHLLGESGAFSTAPQRPRKSSRAGKRKELALQRHLLEKTTTCRYKKVYSRKHEKGNQSLLKQIINDNFPNP